ncbi:MAG: hypothetical protein QOJ42_265 [Acidobacteriaceae bacterium]|nr:hypothetical protein [Acidobacteriaceae bacterium]
MVLSRRHGDKGASTAGSGVAATTEAAVLFGPITMAAFLTTQAKVFSEKTTLFLAGWLGSFDGAGIDRGVVLYPEIVLSRKFHL